MSSTPPVSPQVPAAPAAKGSGGKVFLWILGGCGTLIVLVVVGIFGLGWFAMHKAKQAGLDPELLKKNPALALAKMGAALSPDVDMVSSDDSEGTIVVRDKKTGKQMTLKFDPDKKTMVVTDENGKTGSVKFDPQTHKMVITDEKGKQATITANESAGNIEMTGPEGKVTIGANADKAPSWVPVYPGSNPKNAMSASTNEGQTGTQIGTTKDSPEKVIDYFESALKGSGFTPSRFVGKSDGKTSGMVSGEDKASGRSVIASVHEEAEGTVVSVTYNIKKQP